MAATKKTQDNANTGGDAAQELRDALLDNIDATTGKDKDSSVDLKKGGGYVWLPATASSVSFANVRYPVVALTVMGIDSKEKLSNVYDLIKESVKELVKQTAVKNALDKDETGVSNLPDIVDVKGRKLIGNKYILELPVAINKANATKGRKQTKAYLRAPTTVPVSGVALLQLLINGIASAGNGKPITRIWGPSGRQAYRVPTGSDAAAKLLKMIAKGEKKTPPATEQGTGQ